MLDVESNTPNQSLPSPQHHLNNMTGASCDADKKMLSSRRRNVYIVLSAVIAAMLVILAVFIYYALFVYLKNGAAPVDAVRESPKTTTTAEATTSIPTEAENLPAPDTAASTLKKRTNFKANTSRHTEESQSQGTSADDTSPTLLNNTSTSITQNDQKDQGNRENLQKTPSTSSAETTKVKTDNNIDGASVGEVKSQVEAGEQPSLTTIIENIMEVPLEVKQTLLDAIRETQEANAAHPNSMATIGLLPEITSNNRNNDFDSSDDEGDRKATILTEHKPPALVDFAKAQRRMLTAIDHHKHDPNVTIMVDPKTGDYSIETKSDCVGGVDGFVPVLPGNFDTVISSTAGTYYAPPDSIHGLDKMDPTVRGREDTERRALPSMLMMARLNPDNYINCERFHSDLSKQPNSPENNEGRQPEHKDIIFDEKDPFSLDGNAACEEEEPTSPTPTFALNSSIRPADPIVAGVLENGGDQQESIQDNFKDAHELSTRTSMVPPLLSQAKELTQQDFEHLAQDTFRLDSVANYNQANAVHDFGKQKTKRRIQRTAVITTSNDPPIQQPPSVNPAPKGHFLSFLRDLNEGSQSAQT